MAPGAPVSQDAPGASRPPKNSPPTHTTALKARLVHSADLASRPRPPSSKSSPKPSSIETVTASAATGWLAQAWADGWMTSTSQPGPVSYTHLRAHETVLDLV